MQKTIVLAINRRAFNTFIHDMQTNGNAAQAKNYLYVNDNNIPTLAGLRGCNLILLGEWFDSTCYSFAFMTMVRRAVTVEAWDNRKIEIEI